MNASRLPVGILFLLLFSITQVRGLLATHALNAVVVVVVVVFAFMIAQFFANSAACLFSYAGRCRCPRLSSPSFSSFSFF